MKRKKKKDFPAKYVLLVMVIICAVIIGCSTRMSAGSRAASAAAGYVIVPMQKGVNRIGSVLVDIRKNLILKKKILAENEELKQQLAKAQEELSRVQIDQKEFESLKELYSMDQSYSDYEKTAANVVGKDSGNWFSLFLIDRGSDDGIQVGMNVIADGALAGVVTEVEPNYSKVRSIIDDNSNVSAKNVSTSDLCIVSGSLRTMNSRNMIDFSNMRDRENEAQTGDQVVTSDISDVFLEGIPIGYLADVTTDANNLTKSGHIVTIADFEHMDKVFVIMHTKDYEKKQGE